jgi:hypothetical protein
MRKSYKIFEIVPTSIIEDKVEYQHQMLLQFDGVEYETLGEAEETLKRYIDQSEDYVTFTILMVYS